MPYEQTLYVFRQGQSGVCCFKATPSRKSLPPAEDQQAWTFVRTINLQPGEKPRIGFDADEVQAEVAKTGFALRNIRRRQSLTSGPGDRHIASAPDEPVSDDH